MEVRFLSGVLVGGGAEDVGTLGDEGEALIADDGHVGAVSAAQDVGVKMSVGGPWATMPPLMQTTCGRWAATELISWVVITIVTPWWLSS